MKIENARERGEGQTERKIDAINKEARKCKGEQSGGRLVQPRLE